MDDRVGFERHLLAAEHPEEHVLMDILDVSPVHQIFPFVRLPKFIDDDDIAYAFRIQLPDKRASYESGPTGDNYHARTSPSPCTPRTISIEGSVFRIMRSLNLLVCFSINLYGILY